MEDQEPVMNKSCIGPVCGNTPCNVTSGISPILVGSLSRVYAFIVFPLSGKYIYKRTMNVLFSPCS